MIQESQVIDIHVPEDKQCREYDNRKLNDVFEMEVIDNAGGRLSILKYNASTQ